MSKEDKPTVLIVGAGLGGLMLGALLEKSGVPYTIFERSAAVKPLGSAMVLGPTLLPVFEQLGIYDELLAIGKYLPQTLTYKESLQPMPPLDLTPVEEFTGYGNYTVSRPMFYDLILKQVPPHKVQFGHRVLNITEEDNKAVVHLSNNTIFVGDIIVGADGAYSAVRQRMYEQLRVKGELPKADQEDLPFSCTCLVGQTGVLDPEKFPIVALPKCLFNSVHGQEKPFSWHTFNTAQGTICWMVLEHLSKKSSKAAMEQRFRDTNNSEWGDNPAQAMCNETRTFPLPLEGGKTGTLGDLYDATPKEYISKVMLEEKVFKTWHHRRFVLLGDGAVTAMHDAIALANLLYAMPTKTSSEITTVFEEYHKERYPAVMESYNNSKQLAKIFDTGIEGTIVNYLTTHMPTWLWRQVGTSSP
ncbi:hypothetical protein BGZ96_006548 [Linnemannia gamsii]|uniref:FAD-binding domain-containing protein n=1 Tax=Linnemannia gamsii TaxID=64522 RepID=A0ABQ7K4L9_9FUNG|nr:hypothetical protein BGZ96_006548 [Linnemannia gamsii]